MDKTTSAIYGVIDVLNKEFEKVDGLNCAVARLQAVESEKNKLDQNLSVYEKFIAFTAEIPRCVPGPEQKARMEAHLKILAGLTVIFDYLVQNPGANMDDVCKLKITLPESMDMKTLFLLARCSRISAALESTKKSNFGNIFAMAKATGEGAA
jgi:hypothetical protein